ncbi:protein obstructor-E-like [Amphibalanus amphitrite]|uniref:protein obstructor-E-like n=1 Tax=Amphibalanus amphitrite TaxID=1232801 RepID=UPI001C8FE98D|nr:protein obstructor-E-like [Amphibalanus amphitrite]XP_043212951.1 protein obstructor-E-like [Amphibalanus amphitrite]
MWRSLVLCFLLLALASGLRPPRRRARPLRRGPPRGAVAADTPAVDTDTTTPDASTEAPPPPPPTTTERPSTTTTRVTTRRTTAAPEPLPDVDYETECPEKYGFFADAFQCDRYYECHNYQITEHLCPDGMVFNDFSTEYGRCDLMHVVNCTGREELQEPQPAGPLCPRQNGYYPDPDPTICNKFTQCTEGKANHLTCPAGLLFSLTTSTCQWPDQAGRNCNSEEYLDFQCPGTKIVAPGPGQPLHPRFEDPKDCQFFFSCLDGVVPRRHGCEQGRVFNADTKRCDDPENVSSIKCQNWYKG